MERDSKGRFLKGGTSDFKGKKRNYSEETLEKMSKSFFKKGFTPWNKDTKGVMPVPWNKDAKGCFSDESIQKMIKSRIGKPHPRKYKDGFVSPRKGMKHTLESLKKMSESHKQTYINGLIHHFLGVKGENHPAWKGGKTFESYSIEWNKEFKEQVRIKYNYICQECGVKQKDNDEKLAIHHINYDKKNNEITNLIPLCRKCHGKTIWNRDYWQRRYEIFVWTKEQYRQYLRVS